MNGNTVNITGGTFAAANISGGYSLSGNANYNTVVLDNASLVLGDLFGGHSANANANAGDFRTGNRLVMKNKAIVTDVGNFEHYDFYINKSTDDALLIIAGGGSIDLGTDAHFTVNITAGSDIKIGSFIELIDFTSGGTFAGTVGSSYGFSGISILYNLTENTLNDIFGMTVTSSKVNPKSTAFPDSRLASFSFMNQASDLIFGEGIASAISATSSKPSQWAFFGLISGVYSGYDTKIDDTTGRTTFGGPSFMLGGANTTSLINANILASLYFETGIGFIDSEIDTVYGSVNTDGNANYYGGGALVRYGMNNGFYTEGFLRLGALDNKMESESANANVENNSVSMYLGAGLNLGYELGLFNSRDMLDVYTRYIWGNLFGTDAKLDGQDYKFDNINSHQVSVGVRYTFIEESIFSPYLGMAAKYEFDAKSAATINGDIETASTSLKGFTGLPEIGLRLTPSESMNLTMALSFGGHFGATEGFDTSFDIEYLF